MHILSEKMSCDLLNALGHNDDRFSCFALIFINTSTGLIALIHFIDF